MDFPAPLNEGRDVRKILNFLNNFLSAAKSKCIKSIQGGYLKETPGGTVLVIGGKSSSSAGGSSSSVLPAKVVSKSGAFYIVDIYANGLDQEATATNQTAKVLMLNYANTLPAGTEIMVVSNFVISTGGG